MKRSYKAAFVVGLAGAAAIVIGVSIASVLVLKDGSSPSTPPTTKTPTNTSHNNSSPSRRFRRNLRSSSVSVPGIEFRASRQVRQSDNSSSSSNNNDPLECRLSLFEFLYDEGRTKSSKDVYMCSPMVNGEATDDEYEIEIDDNLRKQYKKVVRDGYEPVLSISGGATVDEANAKINLPEGGSDNNNNDDVRMEMVVDRKRRRKLLETTGKLSALVVRVVLRDEQPDYSKDELYRVMFQDSVSLKSQYQSCSFGKLVIEPSSAGVVEVHLDFPTSISSHQTVVNAANRAVLEHLYDAHYGSYESVRQYADMILYVLPTMGNWLAYGSVGGGSSVYNNQWGGYIASIMHETG